MAPRWPKGMAVAALLRRLVSASLASTDMLDTLFIACFGDHDPMSETAIRDVRSVGHTDCTRQDAVTCCGETDREQLTRVVILISSPLMTP